MNTKHLGVIIGIIALGSIAYAALNAPWIRPRQMIGGQKDANDCLISAGYSWCEAKRDCIRPWETYCTSAKPVLSLFVCKDGKTIAASFYPEDDKAVDLVMSGETRISLPHATSASGARYAKEDDSIVFWNKGDTAFITENGKETFSDCIGQKGPTSNPPRPRR